MDIQREDCPETCDCGNSPEWADCTHNSNSQRCKFKAFFSLKFWKQPVWLKFIFRFHIGSNNGTSYSNSSWSPSSHDQSVERRHLRPETSINWNSSQRKYCWSYRIWAWILKYFLKYFLVLKKKFSKKRLFREIIFSSNRSFRGIKLFV